MLCISHVIDIYKAVDPYLMIGALTWQNDVIVYLNQFVS